MVAENKYVAISGADFTGSATVQMMQLYARSGLALLEVHCDSLGRIGSISVA